MDMYKVKWTRLQTEIFRLLCIKSGEKINQRNLAKLLKVSPTAVSNSLEALEKDKIIVIKKQGQMNLLFIELNRDNPKVIAMKRVENLKMVYESGFVDFMFNKFPGTTIILFGSYSQGGDVITSDIDIAVIGMHDVTMNLDKFEELLQREININFYRNWKDIQKNLKNNILNGILLSGGIEL